MKVLCEITNEDDELYRKQFYLLHFGTTYQIVDAGDGMKMPVSYSVALCQEVETGQIMSILPDSLRIIGEDITKLKTPKKCQK